MVIQHNMQAMNTNRQLGISVGAGAKSTEKLSSGYRINRAGDDAAGLAISEKMRSQIRGLDRASSNSQDGISLIQTAEGALNETQNILQRMRELAVQAANGTNTDSDRNEIQKEVNQLTSEINRIGNTTEFNTMKLLKGSDNGAKVDNVDSTLVAAGTGKGGDIGDFTINKKSTQGNESIAQLIGNTGQATGKVDSALTNETPSVKGQKSSVSIAGVTFEGLTTADNLSNKNIRFVTIEETGTEGIMSGAMSGIAGDTATNDTITIALKGSTIEKFTHVEDLINTINGFASGAGAVVKFNDTMTGKAASSLTTQKMKVIKPEGTDTGISADLSKIAGTIKESSKFTAPVVAASGVYHFNISGQIKEAGDTITIMGQTFKAVDSRTGAIVHADQGEFDIASGDKIASLTKQAANLAAAVNANAALKDILLSSGLTATSGQIKFTEKGGHEGKISSLGTSIKLEGSGGPDDTLDITNPDGTNGIIYKLASGKGALNVGFDGDHTVTITLGLNASDNTAEKIQEQIRLLGKKNTDLRESLSDTTSPTLEVDFSNVTTKAGGNWNTSTTGYTNTANKPAGGATGGGLRSEYGKYSFTLKSAMTEGDKVTVLGKTFVAKENGNALKGEINITSKSITDQASALRSALMQDKDISSKYDVSVDGGKVTLTEKEISGTDLKTKDVSIKTAAGGKFKVELEQVLKDGSALMIDGKKINVSSKAQNLGYEDGTAIKEADSLTSQATALADAINKNTEMGYSASVDDDGNLILTQSETTGIEPEISITGSDKGTFNVTFQVGANTGQSMTIAIGDNRSAALGVAGDGSSKTVVAENGAKAYYTESKVVTDGTTNDNVEYALDISSYEKATAAIGVIDDALSSISAQSSQLGAYQNRLEHTIANLDNTSENLQASESRIRDVDMAKEMTTFSKNNILQQAAQSMLAQANQSTQGVLTLLR